MRRGIGGKTGRAGDNGRFDGGAHDRGYPTGRHAIEMILAEGEADVAKTATQGMTIAHDGAWAVDRGAARERTDTGENMALAGAHAARKISVAGTAIDRTRITPDIVIGMRMITAKVVADFVRNDNRIPDDLRAGCRKTPLQPHRHAVTA